MHALISTISSRAAWLRHMQENQQSCGSFKTTMSPKFNAIMGVPVTHVACHLTFEKGIPAGLFGFARTDQKFQLLMYGISLAAEIRQ